MSGEITPIMKRKWAKDYPEYLGYYYQDKPRGVCGCCGYSRLIERHMVRSPISGDVAEIGWICYGHWCEYHDFGIIDHRFADYKAQAGVAKRGSTTVRSLLRDWGRKHPGKKLPADKVRDFEKEAEEADRIAELKKRGKIHCYDYPIDTFENLEEAREWAKERDGFVTLPNPVTIRDEEKWRVYVLLEKEP